MSGCRVSPVPAHCDKLAYMSDQAEQTEQGAPDDRVRFMAKLPRDLHRWLKVVSAESGENMNDIFVGALQSHREALEKLWGGPPAGRQP